MSVVERERAPDIAVPREVTTADVLERAAYLLEEEIVQWGQHAYVCANGARCMWGAVTLAWQESGLPMGAYSPFGFVEDKIPLSVLPGTKWNDAPGRTKAEVVTALRDAAAKTRA